MNNIGVITVVLSLIWLVDSNVVQSQIINGSSIYGVRWFLAEKFRFQEPITVVKKQSASSHLIAYFNSFQKWDKYKFSIEIESEAYECFKVEVQLNITSNHHKNFNQFASAIGQSYTYYIHKCPILFQNEAYLSTTSLLNYKILAQAKQQKISLFESVLRSPSYNQQQMQMTVFGDWGTLTNYSKQSKLSVPITQCLSKQILSNQNIRMMLLLGDLGYDLQGENYFNFFNYLQPYSKQLVIVFTPGNHQNVKHQDIFELVKQSFYSPFWSHFYGYFDFIQLGKYVLIGYCSQRLFPKLAKYSNSSSFEVDLKQQYKDHFNLFKMQLPQATKNRLKQYTVIGYSHYPIYCNEEDEHQSCNNYLNQHIPYLQLFQQIGMGLYFSGHLHIYERSKQICNNRTLFITGTAIDGVQSYRDEKGCTIFIVQGVGGNNYYIQTSHHFKLKNHTAKAVDNTGFGVLTLDYNNQITKFRHILANKCQIADSIFLSSNPTKYVSKKATKLIIMVLTVLAILALVGRSILKRKGQLGSSQSIEVRRSQTNVIEMVETE